MKNTSRFFKGHRKWLSLLLAVSVIMSLMPTVAFAEDGQTAAKNSSQQIVNPGGTIYYDEDGNVTDKALGEGAVVGLSKTISGTSEENVFDITLKVETTLDRTENITTETTTYYDSAVVLTIDMSGTMHRDDKKMDGQYSIDVAKAKALEFLDKYKASAEANEKRKLAIVGFDTDATTALGWTDVNTTEGYNAAKRAINGLTVVPDTKLGGVSGKTSKYYGDQNCTNFDGGLALTRNLLNASGVNKDCSWAIILSDGAPTVTIADPNNSSTTQIKSTYWSGQGYQNAYAGGGWTHPNEVANNINYVNAIAQKANVYFVGVGGDMGVKLFHDAVYGTANGTRTADVKNNPNAFEGITPAITLNMSTADWLTALANGAGGKYISAANSKALADAFNSIAASIASDTQSETDTIISEAWDAVDPIGASSPNCVEFLGFFSDKKGSYTGADVLGQTDDGDTASLSSGPKINWDLKASDYTTENGVYTYSIKYRVRLTNETDGFVENQAYDTNGETTFTYQTVTDNVFGPEKEVNFPIPSVKGYLGELTIAKTDMAGAALEGAEFTLTHDEDCCDIEDVDDVIAYEAEGNLHKFTNIPSGHKYVLTETAAPDGYEAGSETYSVEVAWDKTKMEGKEVAAASPVTVKNKKLSSITITKALSLTTRGDEEANAAAAKDLLEAQNAYEFDIKDEAGNIVETVYLPQLVQKEVPAPDGGVQYVNELEWSVTVDNLPAGEYTVEETDKPDAPTDYDYSVDYGANKGKVSVNNGASGKVTVTNIYKYVPNAAELAVTKVWEDADDQDGMRPDTVRFALFADDKMIEYKDAADGASFMYDANKYRNKVMTVREIGYTVDGQYTAGNVPGYTPSYSEDGTTITNTYKPVELTFPVEKRWDKSAEGKETTVIMVLKADGETAAELVIGAENGWKGTFTAKADGTPLYKYADGREIVYTLEELDLGRGWTSSVQKAGEGWIVTNSYRSGGGGGGGTTFTSVSVDKVWDDNNNEAGLRPDSVTVQLLDNGSAYGSAVTLSEANDWTYTWASLPDDGKYSVEEVDVPEGYTSSVRGFAGDYTITNTYEPVIIEEPEVPGGDKELDDPVVEIEDPDVPLDYVEIIDPDVPKTSDASNVTMWIILALLSAAALGVSLAAERKQNR